MNTYYFPSNDNELSTWAVNLKTKIESLAPTLGLTPDQVSALNKYCDAILDKTSKITEQKKQMKALQEDKKLVLEREGGLLRNLINHIKTLPTYTPGMGQELGVVSSYYGINPEEYKPKISVELFTGYLRFKYTKNGVDAMNIYYRKKGTTDWIFISRTSKSPFDFHLATQVEPEKWEIRALGVIDDKEIGKASDIIEVLVSR